VTFLRQTCRQRLCSHDHYGATEIGLLLLLTSGKNTEVTNYTQLAGADECCSAGTLRIAQISDHLLLSEQIQCEPKKNPPWGYLIFFHFFHKRLRIFNWFLHTYYTFLCTQIFVQLSPTLTKLCHIMRDYLVRLICAKCPKHAKTRAFKLLRKSLIALLIVVWGKSL